MDMIKRFWRNNRQLIVFIALMSVFRSAVADWYTVPSGSMQPTIAIGDRVLVNKMAYDVHVPFTQISLMHTGDPDYNDIVVFESEAADKRMIKRVVALPGDSIKMVNDLMYVNGKPLQQKLGGKQQTEVLNGVEHLINIELSRPATLSSFPDVVVPADHYLVLGDNRRNSSDSRVYGFVPRSELKGKAHRIAFSLDYDNYYMPRDERFLKPLI